MKLIKLLCVALCVTSVGACDTHREPEAGDRSVVAAPAVSATQQPSPRVMQMWSRSCALCHVDGNAGAPRMGNADEWSPRLAQGQETLLKHTVEGLNSMPPLGYCMACEREDFISMIEFMTAGLEGAL